MDTAIAQLQRRAIEFATSGNFGSDSLAANLELSRLAPDNEGAWTRLSRCYMEGGQLEEATGALDSVLAINPRNSIARSLKIEVNKRRASLLPVEPKVKATRARAAKRVRAEDSRAEPRTPSAARFRGGTRGHVLSGSALRPFSIFSRRRS